MTRLLALLALLATPALAEQPYDDFSAGIADCVAAADGAEAGRACIGTGAGACFDGAPDGQTTTGMMFCALAERDAWDRLLNEEYGLVRDAARAADDAEREDFPEFARRVEQLRNAQRAWIAYRDANCAMEYGLWGAGSMRQIAGADCQMRMTAERMLELRSYRQQLGG
ncbi:lysozyme inhibitor LprI family protein [Pararhodobacter sp.]|uniref:lysozyme inhibitor LprI family protein n=1 Tax=Pararhodobacter sp. TaxID=2127056 RepID=UPI002FE0B55E